MKLRKTILCVMIACMLLSVTMVSALKPDSPPGRNGHWEGASTGPGGSATLWLDPTIDPNDPRQNPAYTQDGTGGTGTSDGTQIIVDRSNTGSNLAFFRQETSAGGPVTVEVNVKLTSGVTNGDAGFHFIINPGSGGEVRVGLFAETGVGTRAGILGGGLAPVQSLDFDWPAGGTFRMERTAAGGAILHVGSNSTPEVTEINLSPTSRPGPPTFEFGFLTGNQQDKAFLGAISEVGIVAPPVGLVATLLKIFPSGAEKVQFDAVGTLPAGASIDPTTENVELRLSTGGAEFYPDSRWANPISGFNNGDPWSITNAEKKRTGIESFTISHPDENDQFQVHFVDTKADIPDLDYSTVEVELTIGDDTFTIAVEMTRTK